MVPEILDFIELRDPIADLEGTLAGLQMMVRGHRAKRGLFKLLDTQMIVQR